VAVVDKINSALQLVAARHQPFDLTVHGTGSVSERKPGALLWVGCDDSEGKLNVLARAIPTAMQPLGFEPERGSSPRI